MALLQSCLLLIVPIFVMRRKSHPWLVLWSRGREQDFQGLWLFARRPRETEDRSYAHCPYTSPERQPSITLEDAGTGWNPNSFFFWVIVLQR
jgi:hypothetical protein